MIITKTVRGKFCPWLTPERKDKMNLKDKCSS